ncbi:MAG TPA: IS1634 family transposase, partial [Myxococcota bacterium]|nr:IS1634 family transposase [Myxococcota bacterium]
MALRHDVKHAQRTFEYVDIVESRRVGGKVVQSMLGTLGRRDEVTAEKVDALIRHLRKLASPESGGILIGELEINAVRDYGGVLVTRQLWQELGLDRLLGQLPHLPSVDLEEAVFRMVCNRLLAPSSKLALTDWEDDQGILHRGWQGQIEWPSGPGELAYQHYLRAMDALHPHRQQIEDHVFARVTELFSLPLNLVLYDLTSSYFEGDGVSELAEFGHSRDHREDRRQIVVGLAVTQEGLPIMQRVFKGNTADVTTLKPVAQELGERFGLKQPAVVADKGMFSADNLAALEASGFRYVLALRDRSDAEGERAVKLAFKSGLPIPKGPKLLLPQPNWAKAEYTLQEVALEPGVRHLVIYSSHKALHDFEVRERRLERSLEALRRLREQAAVRKLSQKQIMERATRILVEHKSAQYFGYLANKAFFSFWLKRDVYRRRRRHDGLFVLRTNHPGLSGQEVLDTYLQLQEIERCFRVIKSVL